MTASVPYFIITEIVQKKHKNNMEYNFNADINGEKEQIIEALEAIIKSIEADDNIQDKNQYFNGKGWAMKLINDLEEQSEI